MKNGVYLYVTFGRENQNLDFFLSGLCVRNRLISTQWSFMYGGREYDSQRLSVTSFILDIPVVQNERLCTEY
jgi:hypothetical protein